MKIRLNQNVLWNGDIRDAGQVIDTDDENLLNFGEKIEEAPADKAEEPSQETKPKTTRTRRTAKKE